MSTTNPNPERKSNLDRYRVHTYNNVNKSDNRKLLITDNQHVSAYLFWTRDFFRYKNFQKHPNILKITLLVEYCRNMKSGLGSITHQQVIVCNEYTDEDNLTV